MLVATHKIILRGSTDRVPPTKHNSPQSRQNLLVRRSRYKVIHRRRRGMQNAYHLKGLKCWRELQKNYSGWLKHWIAIWIERCSSRMRLMVQCRHTKPSLPPWRNDISNYPSQCFCSMVGVCVSLPFILVWNSCEKSGGLLYLIHTYQVFNAIVTSLPLSYNACWRCLQREALITSHRVWARVYHVIGQRKGDNSVLFLVLLWTVNLSIITLTLFVC